MEDDIRNQNDVKTKSFKKQSKENGVMEEEETITGAMEVISFDNTFGEMESVIESNLFGNKINTINFVALYITINEYKQSVTIDKVKVQNIRLWTRK